MLNQDYNANKVRPGSEGPRRRFCSKSCPWVIAVTGVVSILLGCLVLRFGRYLLVRHVVSRKMAIEPDSPMLQSWLSPPVETFLTVYAFDVVNAGAVVESGEKPVVKEVGPFVYKSTVVKDSEELLWGSGGSDGPTMRYRPRKIMTFVPEMSATDRNITVPNIPFLTGLNGMSEVKKIVGVPLLASLGRGTPFINVTVQGLLWGYEDELPCSKMNRPKNCGDNGVDDDFDEDEDSFFGDVGFRKKRDVEEVKLPGEKPKAEFVDCKCNWGLFRDRNVTLREPIEFVTGSHGDRIFSKGEVVRFNDKREFGYWKPGSQCDRVRGQDASTFPPGLSKDVSYKIFIPVICRPLPLVFEEELTLNDVDVMKFVLPKNALGSHNDSDPELQNPENECYCLKGEGFECHKSGVLNLGPCKRSTGTKPPLAVSLPHFYNSDPSYVNGVIGLDPQADLHEFFLLLVPELGIPLAIRPRFQINVALKRDGNLFKNLLEDEMMIPVLWAQDGFDVPSPELMKKVSKGVHLPSLIVSCFGAVAIAWGIILLAIIYCWCQCHQKKEGDDGQATDGFSMVAAKRPLTKV